MTLKPKHNHNNGSIQKIPKKPRPKKARQVRSNVKVSLTGFFDCNGVVHHEFLPQGRMVNKEYYLEAKCLLREAIRQNVQNFGKTTHGGRCGLVGSILAY